MLRRPRVFWLFATRLLALALLPIIVLTLFQGSVFQKMDEDRKRINDYYFENISDGCEGVLTRNYACGVSLMEHSYLQSMFSLQNDGSETSARYMSMQYAMAKTLKGLTELDVSTDSIYLYNARSGSILTSEGILSSSDTFHDTSWISALEDCHGILMLPERAGIDADYQGYIFDKSSLSVFNSKQDMEKGSAVVTLLFPVFYNVSLISGAVVVNIRKDSLISTSESSEYSCFLTDKNGAVISSVVTDDDDLQSALETYRESFAEAKHYAQIKTANNTTYTILSNPLGIFGLTFSMAFSTDAIKRAQTELQILASIIILLAILLSVSITLHIITRYGKPFMAIFREAEKAVPEIGKMSSLKEIADAVTVVISQHQTDKEPRNDPIGDMFGFTRKNTDAADRAGSFFCAVLSIDKFSYENERHQIDALCAQKWSFVSAAKAFFADKSVQCNGMLMNEDKTALVFRYDEEADEMRIKGDIADYLRKLTGEFNTSVSIGVGGVYKKQSDLSKSYTQALSALRYRLVLGYGCIAFYADICRREVSSVAPEMPNFAKLFTSEIKVDEIKRSILTYFDEMKRYVRGDEMDALVCILPIVNELSIYLAKDITQADSMLSQMYELERILINLETLDDIAEQMSALCIMIHKRYEKGGSDVFYQEKILSIIHGRYMDPSLSINMISDDVGISYSYVCKIMKDQVGMSFANYLSRYRNKIAKELLLSLNAPVAKIAEMVGYSNVQSFVRNFKKFEGSTPAIYRSLHM